MRVAQRTLACLLAASLCCLTIPAAVAMGSPAPSFDGSEARADGMSGTPSQGPNGSAGADTSSPDVAPSPSDGSADRGSDAIGNQSGGTDSTEGSPNGNDAALAQNGTKAASGEDPDPPQFNGATVNKTEVGVGDTLTISYDITDPDGIKSISLIVISPNGSLVIRNTGGEHATEYTSTLIQSTTEKGTYYVIGYRVIDGKNFVSSIISSAYEDKISKTDSFYGKIIPENITVLSYTVTITKDPNSTKFINASIEKTVCKQGGAVSISCDVQDDDGISAIALVLLDPSKNIMLRQGILALDGQSASCTITSPNKAGLYKVIGYRVNDKKGYVASFIDKDYRSSTNWQSTTYGTCTFQELPTVTFLVTDDSKVGAYHILEGANPTIEKGANESLTFRIDGNLSDFIVATVNGTDIPSSDYDLESGSTVITLKPSYLDTLHPGKNEFAAWYNDGGNATTTIEVLSKDDEATASSAPKDPVDEAAAESDRNSSSVGAGLLQSGDKLALYIVFGLLFIGASLAILGAVTTIRKGTADTER